MSGPYKSDWKVNPDTQFAPEQGETARQRRDPYSIDAMQRYAIRAQNGLTDTPPTAPDATDQLLARKRTTSLMLSQAGRGRQGTFRTNTLTGMGAPTTSQTLLGGY